MLPEDRETIDGGNPMGDSPDGDRTAPSNDALEAALSLLQPNTENFDRDGLFYEAGRQSVLRAAAWRSWKWSAASAGLAAAAAAILAIVFQEPVPQVVVQTVYVGAEQQEDVSPPEPIVTGSAAAALVERPGTRSVDPPGRDVRSSRSALGQLTTLHGQSERILEELLAPKGSQLQSLARAVDMPTTVEGAGADAWTPEAKIPHYRLREQWLN